MTGAHTLPLGPDDIKKYLPHRDPILFVHRVTQVAEMSITAESDVDGDADYFKGHFPDMPIMPGVLLIETVAQVGALLVSLTRGLSHDKFIAFSSVESAKFKRPVYPNETLRVEVEIEKVRLPFYKFSGTAEVNGKTVATLKFTAAEMTF